MQTAKAKSRKSREGSSLTRKPLGMRLAQNWQLYLLLLIPVVLTIIYKYIPMYGITIAFKDYKASKGITGSPWVGLKWFERFFTAPTAGRMISNTILLSLYSLLWSFPIPIILSLIINQLRFNRYKRVVQTVLYAPHFISIMVAYWNDWFTALIYLTGSEKAPLPLVLRNVLIKSSASASQASTISGGYAELNKITEIPCAHGAAVWRPIVKAKENIRGEGVLHVRGLSEQCICQKYC